MYRRLLLPGIILQSVLIGGAYATGREIVQFGARFGHTGWWSVLAIFIGFSVMSILAFEFARTFRGFDYRTFMRALIGPIWPLFDVLLIIMTVITIAVVSSASGSVLEQILGWPYWLGVGLVMVLVGGLIALGRNTIERFKTFGSFLLYGGFAVFAIIVIVANAERSGEVAPARLFDPVSPGMAFWTGILYVGYNLGVMPATLFVLDGQTSRRDTITSGLIAGLLATIPFVLTYVAITGTHSREVLDAEVPWLIMLEGASGMVVAAYALVVFWTLIETATGMIHAVTDRVSVHLEESGRSRLSGVQLGLITVGVLAASAVLSHFGIIALVAKGYGMMSYGFLALFALPLITIGVWRMWKGRA